MSDGEILMTRRVDRTEGLRQMSKIVLTFTVMGKPMKIHIEFKTLVPIESIPVAVLESEEAILEDLEAQIYVTKSADDEMAKIVEIAHATDEKDEEEDENSEDQDK